MTYFDIVYLFSNISRRQAALSSLQPPIAYTNGYYLHLVTSPLGLCEWDPDKARPARLSDPYHAVATVILGRRDHRYRVCDHCASLPEVKAAARVTKTEVEVKP